MQIWLMWIFGSEKRKRGIKQHKSCKTIPMPTSLISGNEIRNNKTIHYIDNPHTTPSGRIIDNPHNKPFGEENQHD